MNPRPGSTTQIATRLKLLWQKHSRLSLGLLGSLALFLVLMGIFSRTSSEETVATVTETPLTIEHQQAEQSPTADNITVTTANPQPTIPAEPENKLTKVAVKIKRGESLSHVFRRLGLNHGELLEIVAAHPHNRQLTKLHTGESIRITYDKDQKVHELFYQPSLTKVLQITRNGDSFDTEFTTVPLESRQAFAHGTIRQSLFSAGKSNNVPSHLLHQLVGLFQWDVDFGRDIHNGDSFSILYEEKYLDGRKVSTGNILAAEFVNHGKAYRAVRYVDSHGNIEYYTPEGRNLKKRFTRTPVKFTRISSKFSIGRWHPILHRMRKHKGVDYAAPTGTPIKATANGRIVFKGRKGGYGNCVTIDHGDKYSTLYGHMSAFAKNFHVGSRVRQGEVIGYVGMTGLASGPHLHYEFLVNGEHRDPLSSKLPTGEPIPASQLRKFRANSRLYLAHLQTHKKVELAKANHRDNKA